MIKQTSRIYKVDEREMPDNKDLLFYMADGSVNIADKSVFETCPSGICYWCEIPPVESAFQRARREATEKA